MLALKATQMKMSVTVNISFLSWQNLFSARMFLFATSATRHRWRIIVPTFPREVDNRLGAKLKIDWKELLSGGVTRLWWSSTFVEKWGSGTARAEAPLIMGPADTVFSWLAKTFFRCRSQWAEVGAPSTPVPNSGQERMKVISRRKIRLAYHPHFLVSSAPFTPPCYSKTLITTSSSIKTRAVRFRTRIILGGTRLMQDILSLVRQDSKNRS